MTASAQPARQTQPATQGFACRICGSATGVTHHAREMMFGRREPFTYFECHGCGCVQLADPPADLAPYYPPNYLNHESHNIRLDNSPSGVRGWVADRRNEAQLLGRGGPWRALAALRPRPDIRPLPAFLSRVPELRFRSRIVDVGCGWARLLHTLAAVGFRDLTGVDPYLRADSRPSAALRLVKGTVHTLTGGPYDLILFNHVLEHVADPVADLTAARRLLAPGGVCVVRVPTASSAVWKTYGTDWVELDAPRHLFVFSHDSLRRTAETAGLRLTNLVSDSEGFGYWGSELYRRDLSLMDPETGAQRIPAAYFTPAELARFDAQAEADNWANAGGRLTAYLRHTP
jgi:SAM-dependent methyltransferase